MEQFEREMTIMSQVSHTNIVTLFEIIREGLTLSVTQSAFASTSDRPLCFPRACAVSSDHAPLITRTRYLPVIISYRPSFSLRSASGAPCQPDNSVLTHITHS